MRKWKLKLLSGTALRKEIQKESSNFSSYVNLLEKLKNCWNEIRKKYQSNDVNPDDMDLLICGYTDEVDDYIYEFSSYDIEDIPTENDEESVNALLRDFYNFCDYYSIWVEL